MTMMYGGCKLKPKVKELRAKLAAAEKERDGYKDIADKNYESWRADFEVLRNERDEALAHNAVLRQAIIVLNEYLEGSFAVSGIQAWTTPKIYQMLIEMAAKAITSPPSDSAAKVRKLVDALELMVDTIDDQLGGGGWVPEFEVDIDEKLEPWASIFDAQEKAQKALAEWRGE